MEERERSVLRRSRSIFIRDLVDVITVCDRLYQREVLSEGMKNEILSESTRESQVRTLMDIIPKRGQKAYGAFIDVLEETYQYNLASILCPGGRPNTPSPKHLSKPESQRSVGPLVIQQSWMTGAKREPMESIGEFQTERRPVESFEEDPEPGKLNVELPGKLDISLQENDLKMFRIKEEEFVLPKDWPSEPDHAQSMDFQVRKSQHSIDHSRVAEDKANVYQMKELTRGRLVIINNFQFGSKVDEARMKRSQQDATSLDVLFKQLHFQTKQHSNLTLKNLSSVIEGERTRDHASLECFIMVIMSRGDGERIYGVDGYKIDIDAIVSLFDREHCSSLRGKPKIFIFQTCSDAPKFSDDFQKKSASSPTALSSLTLEDPDHLRTDMFVVRATKDVEVNYNGVFGSRFIQSFVYLMRNLVCEEDFEEIVQKINHLNALSEPEIVEYTSSFTKKLYFNP